MVSGEFLSLGVGRLRERAKGIEDKLPQWGKLLFQAALGDPAAAAVLGPWRRTQPGDQSLRRFTVFVDPTSSSLCALRASVFPTIPGKQENTEAQRTQRKKKPTPTKRPRSFCHCPGNCSTIRNSTDGTAYLFRGARGVRVRRRLPDAEVVEPAPAEPPIRVLLVSPRPEDDVASYIDHRISARPVVDALAKLGELAELTLLDPPTLSALDAELRRAFEAGRPYHVVHFDGHGVYDKRHGLGSLCFEQDP